MTKLAILIPTTPDREELLLRICQEIARQAAAVKADIRVLIELDNREQTTGAKRNTLLERAVEVGAQAISFVDSDDLVGPTYVERGLQFADSGMDCAELYGQIYFDGKKGMPFHHYLGCTHAWQDDKMYYRPANHLNFMKLELVKDFKFQDKTFGEDMTWAMEIQDAGRFKTMMEIPEIIYHYFVGNPKHAL